MAACSPHRTDPITGGWNIEIYIRHDARKLIDRVAGGSSDWFLTCVCCMEAAGSSDCLKPVHSSPPGGHG